MQLLHDDQVQDAMLACLGYDARSEIRVSMCQKKLGCGPCKVLSWEIEIRDIVVFQLVDKCLQVLKIVL